MSSIPRSAKRENVRLAVLKIAALLEEQLPEYALKRRDPREPGRREKEAAEDALLLFMLRHFRRQARQVKERAASAKAIPYTDDLFMADEDEIAELTRLLLKNTRNGVLLFGAATGITIDYTMTNLEAAEWARKYAGQLIREIDDYSLEVVRKALAYFVETPGVTMGDLVDLLPFNEKRAEMIAVTEVTRTYAEGQMMAGREMRAQFPEVQVKKQWFTNNDDLVCDICGPLDGEEVNFEDGFGVESGEAGLMEPPAHPRCRCWMSTYTALAEID